jgi:UDPglucose 6-dehydrogenase
VNVVAKGMGLDGRIGPKFLHAGAGFGGSCLPKDTKALLKIAAEHDIELAIVNAAVKANERQIKWATEKIKNALSSSPVIPAELVPAGLKQGAGIQRTKILDSRLHGNDRLENHLNSITIAILGLSFKPNTDDIRESPAIAIIQNLLNDGVNIRAYDPVAMENAKKLLTETSVIPLNPPFNITFCNDAYDACNGADAVVIVTEWNQFRNLEIERVKQLLKQPYFFDLRNIYDPQKMQALGFRYYSVGR